MFDPRCKVIYVTRHGSAFNLLSAARSVQQMSTSSVQEPDIMFIFANQSLPSPLNHPWRKIFSEISSVVIETDGGCTLGIFLVFTRPTNGTFLFFVFFFSWTHFFLVGIQRGFLDQQSRTLK